MLMRFSLLACLLAFAQPPSPPPARAFSGATLIDGTGRPAVTNAVLIVRDRKIVAAGPAATVTVPKDAQRVDLTGKFLMPGIVNAHGHVGATVGLENRADGYTRENLLRQLGLYARYGVTTVVSLGDDREAGFQLRAENDRPDLNRSRLYVAGPVISAKTPDEARNAVDAVAKLRPDWIKIRVDDNLGTTEKMRPDVYRAVIARAHEHQLRVAAHIFYLADAKDLLRAGVDYLAHSVRDAPVDREMVDLMKARNVCLCPTLMREVSTFVYESRPSFFDDPFFKRDADPNVIAALQDPSRMAGVAASTSAQQYKRALDVARANVKTLHDAGIRLAAGTDTGPPARFQGYFEHLELEEMVKSGLTPAQTIASATGVAAQCLGLDERVGTLQPGRSADFLVLTKNPLNDIRDTRTIESVWIDGNRMGK
jgi:imidazolonepropionase-like amidohydrolase